MGIMKIRVKWEGNYTCENKERKGKLRKEFSREKESDQKEEKNRRGTLESEKRMIESEGYSLLEGGDFFT